WPEQDGPSGSRRDPPYQHRCRPHCARELLLHLSRRGAPPERHDRVVRGAVRLLRLPRTGRATRYGPFAGDAERVSGFFAVFGRTSEMSTMAVATSNTFEMTSKG